jgi:quercetin dioxygenase-like cupin family protein
VTEAETRQVKLVQSVIECQPNERQRRAPGDCEEVLFVIAGNGTIDIAGTTHELEPESGVYIAPGEHGTIAPRTAMRLVSVVIPDPAPGAGTTGGGTTGGGTAAVRRLGDQQRHDATTDREFRIVADPGTGLRSATHFVGYIPTATAPDHFHTYDEVIYVLDGEGVLHTAAGERPLASGSEIELPARTVHCLENTGASVMRVVAVFRPAGSPAAAYYPDGTPAHESAPVLHQV